MLLFTKSFFFLVLFLTISTCIPSTHAHQQPRRCRSTHQQIPLWRKQAFSPSLESSRGEKNNKTKNCLIFSFWIHIVRRWLCAYMKTASELKISASNDRMGSAIKAIDPRRIQSCGKERTSQNKLLIYVIIVWDNHYQLARSLNAHRKNFFRNVSCFEIPRNKKQATKKKKFVLKTKIMIREHLLFISLRRQPGRSHNVKQTKCTHSDFSFPSKETSRRELCSNSIASKGGRNSRQIQASSLQRDFNKWQFQ